MYEFHVLLVAFTNQKNLEEKYFKRWERRNILARKNIIESPNSKIMVFKKNSYSQFQLHLEKWHFCDRHHCVTEMAKSIWIKTKQLS